MLRDVINEIFFFLMGVFLIWLPFPVDPLGTWLLRMCGLLLLMGLVVTYTVGFRFDKKFKNVLWSDNKLDSKLSLSFGSADFAMTLRLVRATMYARNIAFPKGTSKNWIQKSWFNGYNFRQHARWFDILFSYIYFILIFTFLIYSVILGIYLFATNQLN